MEFEFTNLCSPTVTLMRVFFVQRVLGEHEVKTVYGTPTSYMAVSGFDIRMHPCFLVPANAQLGGSGNG